jgi:hypothetical protein
MLKQGYMIDAQERRGITCGMKEEMISTTLFSTSYIVIQIPSNIFDGINPSCRAELVMFEISCRDMMNLPSVLLPCNISPTTLLFTRLATLNNQLVELIELAYNRLSLRAPSQHTSSHCEEIQRSMYDSIPSQE